jgi:hypothetical protein
VAGQSPNRAPASIAVGGAPSPLRAEALGDGDASGGVAVAGYDELIVA